MLFSNRSGKGNKKYGLNAVPDAYRQLELLSRFGEIATGERFEIIICARASEAGNAILIFCKNTIG